LRYTILGSSGFIGARLVTRALGLGHDVWCPGRNDRLDTQGAGHIIYCVGMTANFRGRSHQTIDAHVTHLQRVLRQTNFDSFTYLSSTRVYRHLTAAVAHEESPLVVSPGNPEDIYNISKILGENLLLQQDGRMRIARLSNVVGIDFTSGNFLSCLLRESVCRGRIHLEQSLSSVKDYVDARFVVDALLHLGPYGRHAIYNVASGKNISHEQIIDRLKELTDAEVTVSGNDRRHCFPRICVERIQQEFNFKSSCVFDQLPLLVKRVREHYRTAA